VQAEPLLSLAAAVAGEHASQGVLNSIVQGLAAQHEVALARVWLLSPGDLCGTCFRKAECENRAECLHLVASSGTPHNSPGEDWSLLNGQFRRIPLGHRKVGEIGATGRSILIPQSAADSEWIGRPEWARREGIQAMYEDKLDGKVDEKFWSRKMADWRTQERALQSAADSLGTVVPEHHVLTAQRTFNSRIRRIFFMLGGITQNKGNCSK